MKNFKLSIDKYSRDISKDQVSKTPEAKLITNF